MWIVFSDRNQRTEREIYLEDELERYREDEYRRLEDQRRERERRERERREEIETTHRIADSWPEALRKQAFLCAREHNVNTTMDLEYGLEPELETDSFFFQCARACERALAIWPEVIQKRQPEIDALQAQIDALKEQIEAISGEIRCRIADLLEVENDTEGWLSVVDALRNEEDPETWLHW